MHLLSILAIILTSIGHIWYAWEVWHREDLFWAIILFIIPFPLLGAYIWYRSGWDSCYKSPAIIYFSGYILGIISGAV